MFVDNEIFCATFCWVDIRIVLMGFVPDYDLARQQVHSNLFNTYTSAYVVTNEDLRVSMNFVPKKCNNALVVAASGDHPLFCSLYGAQHVDTFDVSYNAKCMMDIKVAALSCMDYVDYGQFLEDLHISCKSQSVNITNVKYMDKILQKLPKTEAEYIRALNEEPLFSRGPSPIVSGVLPTFKEYCKLRKKIVKPYDFFLTNVYELGKNLGKSYDFIHLSNIFDYIAEGHYEEILFPLMQHINRGGRILIENFDDEYSFGLDYVENKILSGFNNNFRLKRNQYAHILERVR